MGLHQLLITNRLWPAVKTVLRWSAPALLLGLALLPAASPAAVDRPRCQVCRRFVDKSPSHISAQYKVKEHLKIIDVCCLLCYAERVENLPAPPEYVLMTDYNTRGDTPPRMLATRGASCLYGSEGDAEKCGEPFVFAFTSEDKAKQAREDIGGELVSWKEALKRCVKLAADWKPKNPGQY